MAIDHDLSLVSKNLPADRSHSPIGQFQPLILRNLSIFPDQTTESLYE